jgi:NhaP-type Na+/H+ or K+/H+ antiporter
VVCASGTIRGSVALALILTIEGNHDTENQVSIIKSTVLIMVCLTTIVLGGLMPKCISFFMGKKPELVEAEP